MPNELLPSNIGFGTVVGRFGSAPLIAGDADGFPDFSPAAGLTVTFTPSTAAVIDATASPAPVTIEMVPIVCGLDTQGYLVGGDGQRGVKLIATNDTDINPSGWTYSVTFLRGGSKVAAFRDFSMSLPAGVTKDIALTIPVPSSEGVSLSQAQAAEAAAVSAASAASAAAAAASSAATNATTAATTAVAATVTKTDKVALPYNVKDFGAIGDGATDDTAAIQAVLNLLTVSGSTIPSVSAQLPPGTYKITDTIIVQRKGLYLRGAGCGNSPQAANPGKGTRIVWAGAAGKPMFRVYDAFNFLIEDIAIVGHNTNTPSEGIYFESTTSESGGNNGNLYLNRVTFGKTRENSTNWTMDYCVRFGGINANNDQFRFDDCQFVQPVIAGVKIDQTQSIWGLFINPFFQGNFTAKGLVTNSSTHLVNATHDSCLKDYEIGQSAAVSIDGYYSERAVKNVHLTTYNSRFDAKGGLVGVQWSQTDHSPPGDGIFIQADSLQADGAISLDGVKFYCPSGTRPKIQVRAPSIGATTGGHVFIRNCNLLRNDLDLTCANTRGIYVAWDDDHLFNRTDVVSGGTYTPADTLSGATRADITRRRASIEERTRRAAGQWYMKRTNATEYHFIRNLGQGVYLDQPLKQGITPATTVLLSQTALTIPMLAQDEGTATLGGTWVHAIALSASSGYTPVTFTASVVAATKILTVTSGISLSAALHNGRRLTIAGAGPAGASLDITAANVTSSTTVALGTGTVSADVTNVSVTMWPGYRYSVTAGSTASWSTPVASTAVGVITCKISNGGLAKVSVDGSATAANNLPTAQDLVTAGTYANTILVANGGSLNPTDRVLNCFGAVPDYAAITVVATGLASATHTVLLTYTGYAPVGQTGGRAYVTGFCYATGAETPMTAGSLMATTSLLGASSSAWEYAYSHQPSGLTNDFAGSIHGNEHAVSLGVVMDGGPVTLADGETRVVNGEASILRVTELNHIDAPSTVYATITTSYRLTNAGLIINHVDRWALPTTVVTGYTAMVPLNGYLFDKFQFDTDVTSTSAVAGDGSQLGKHQTASLASWDGDGNFAIGITIVAPDVATGNWSKPLENLWYQDRAPSGGEKFNKVYLSRAGAVAAGDVWSAEWVVSWGYYPEGANKYFPV